VTGPLHGPDAAIGDLADRVSAFVRDRIEAAPLGRTATPAEVAAVLDGSITAGGLGVNEAWRRFLDGVVAHSVGLDSERFLAFVPVSPSAAGVWMDAAVGAATFSAESWLEAAGAVAAENVALDWLGQVIGMPVGAGGCFMSGGSIGNLSALAVGRERAGTRRVVAVADTAHASLFNSLHLLGLQTMVVPTGPAGRCTGWALRELVRHRHDVGMVVGSAGSTNAGVIDDLAGLADVAEEIDAWFHVDAAYGGAAMLLPELRERFVGIERADSVIVDPHKWLFAPEGSCALLYRDPALAAEVHTQHGPYLDVLHGDDGEPGDLGGDARDPHAAGGLVHWNPSDYGYQLTRRASGLPLWFALTVHGVEAHVEAVRHGVTLAGLAAERLAATPGVSLVMQPELGVVLFRREGWHRTHWRTWARRLLADGVAFVAPSTWKSEPVGRLVFMHPRTPTTIIDEIVDSLVRA
jgi:aromatic-L-amino-acid decarboxylase